MLVAGVAQAAAPRDDGFIAGYAAAVLEREFDLIDAGISVQNGAITVQAAQLDERTKARVSASLGAIRGVNGVRVIETGAIPAVAAPTATPTRPAPSNSAIPVVAPVDAGSQILGRRLLFDPLLADPRWPHFSASYRYFRDDPDVEHAGAVGFGETFSLYRDQGLGGRWEIGFQAGVFALFDLNSESMDLINADYMVGIPIAYRRGDFSALGRIYHQSSHLGDEFLLRNSRNGRNRLNLSYEAVDLLLSYDIGSSLRVYGGGGFLFHREPSSLDPLMFQAGVEYESSRRFWDVLRPIAALDVQSREEYGFSPDFAIRAGVQIENPRIVSQKVQLTGEYYNGRNPNGQFYVRDLEYWGIGLHVFFN